MENLPNEQEEAEKVRVLSLLLLPCCGIAQPTYSTAHGIEVFTNGLPERQSHVEVSTEIFINELSQHPSYTEAEVRDFIRNGRYRMHVVEKPFTCLPNGVECSGVATRTKGIYVYDVCQPISAFVHELMHIIQIWMTQADPQHDEDGIWALPGGVVPTARWQACVFLCPKLCAPKEENKRPTVHVEY